jgi:hypothetical protein
MPPRTGYAAASPGMRAMAFLAMPAPTGPTRRASGMRPARAYPGGSGAPRRASACDAPPTPTRRRPSRPCAPHARPTRARISSSLRPPSQTASATSTTFSTRARLRQRQHPVCSPPTLASEHAAAAAAARLIARAAAPAAKAATAGATSLQAPSKPKVAPAATALTPPTGLRRAPPAVLRRAIRHRPRHALLWASARRVPMERSAPAGAVCRVRSVGSGLQTLPTLPLCPATQPSGPARPTLTARAIAASGSRVSCAKSASRAAGGSATSAPCATRRATP